MIQSFWRTLTRRLFGKSGKEIAPEDIFIDSSNLPAFNTYQFEGRLERPIKTRALYGFLAIIMLVIAFYGARAFSLQVIEGPSYAKLSEENRLEHGLIFSDRGVIYDRTGELLVWNEATSSLPFAERIYTEREGLGHTLGYLNYPKQDSRGNFYRESFVAKAGAEKYFDRILGGKNGLALIEVDARGEVQSRSAIQPPEPGSNVTLSLDAALTEELFEAIKERAEASGFRAGSGVIMDVQTGEVVAMASYPEFDSQVLTDGTDNDAIAAAVLSEQKPFLNRVTSGLYSPGSIVKPYVALGALAEGVITENTTIESDGALRIPNPYVPDQYTVYRDWGPKAWGTHDVRSALAISSNVFFMTVGGGFETQEGLGIARLERFFHMFGFGEPVSFVGEELPAGTIPTPDWKARTFDGEPWRVGDTYSTSIGQYGMQVTPLQVARAVAAVANGGTLLDPVLISGARAAKTELPLDAEHLRIVREGMRLVVEEGTGQALDVPFVTVAAKTGTAELGVEKDFVNSVTTGFFPYEAPRYAFVVLMEHGPRSNTIGASAVMLRVLRWIDGERPEYFGE